MAGIGETGRALANGALDGAMLPYKLSMKVGGAVGAAFGRSVSAVVGVPGYLICKGINLVRAQDNQLDAKKAFTVIPVAPFKYVGATLALTSASPALIALTPISAIGGTVFGAIFTVTKGAKNLVGLVAYRPQEGAEGDMNQQAMEQMNRLQERLQQRGGDDPLAIEALIREFYQAHKDGADQNVLVIDHLKGLTNAAGDPIPVTDENIAEILQTISRMGLKGEEVGKFLNEVLDVIQQLQIADGDDLCDGINAYKNFLELRRVLEERGGVEFAIEEFSDLCAIGALNEPVRFQPPVKTIEEMTDQEVATHRTLEDFLAHKKGEFYTAQLNQIRATLFNYRQNE